MLSHFSTAKLGGLGRIFLLSRDSLRRRTVLGNRGSVSLLCRASCGGEELRGKGANPGACVSTCPSPQHSKTRTVGWGGKLVKYCTEHQEVIPRGEQIMHNNNKLKCGWDPFDHSQSGVH